MSFVFAKRGRSFDNKASPRKEKIRRGRKSILVRTMPIRLFYSSVMEQIQDIFFYSFDVVLLGL